MKTRYRTSLAGTFALAASLVGATHAQAPSGTFGQVTPQTKTKVVVIGENNAVRKLDKAGGQAISSAEFFRVTWSPVGAGTLCVVSVSGQTNPADNLRPAIYDNKAVYDYMIKEIRPDYGQATPPIHRHAERLLLLSLDNPLRALDALHVATALDAEAATLVTYDPRLREAARSQGLFVAPDIASA